MAVDIRSIMTSQQIEERSQQLKMRVASLSSAALEKILLNLV